MTLEMLNLMTIPALGALGLWLEGIGGNHGFADKFFSPIPLASPAISSRFLGVPRHENYRRDRRCSDRSWNFDDGSDLPRGAPIDRRRGVGHNP